MTQYKTKREQLLLIKQHALQRQDSGVFPSGSSVGNSASADSCVGSNLDQLQVKADSISVSALCAVHWRRQWL